jgi:tetratricopeptide (TPR) repeat protein
MRESRRANLIIVFSLLMIAAAFAIYATMVLRWFSPDSGTAVRSQNPAATAAARAELDAARAEFRERLLDPRAHMRLSEALWKAGLPVDSFYVLYAARQLFSDDEFRRAHAEVIVGVGGPAAEARARLKGLNDPALTVPVHAEAARDYPDTAEGRDSLEQLARMASDAGAGESAELALTALGDLYRQDPKNPEKLAALGAALIARGDDAKAAAYAHEALNKYPNQGGAERVMGMLALKDRDIDGARKWLNAAWERDAHDLYSASKLAEIYDKRRGDPEEALPFYLALYHENPYYTDVDTVDAETIIRRTLDGRRARLLQYVGVSGLGSRFALDDASLRAEAALRAADFKDPRWIDALAALLDDDCEIVRRNADYALYRIGQAHPEALQPRRDEWLSSPKPLVRIRALNLFADLDGLNVLPYVVQAMADPNPGARAFAVIMVLDHYFSGAPEAARARARFLSKEKDPEVLDFVRRYSSRPR